LSHTNARSFNVDDGDLEIATEKEVFPNLVGSYDLLAIARRITGNH
jgi:hypothetical protein